MNGFFNFNFNDLLGATISLGTLFMAWRIYKKLLPDELKKRQLETVFDLIGHLNNYNFTISKYYNTGACFEHRIGFPSRNFFNYKAQISDEIRLNKSAELRIYLLNEDIQFFDFSEFMENPLLPKEIADQLPPFISTFIFLSNESELGKEDEIFVIEPGGTSEMRPKIVYNQLFKPNAIVLANLGKLEEAMSNLEESIKKWCEENGLKDLNFRQAISRKIS